MNRPAGWLWRFYHEAAFCQTAGFDLLQGFLGLFRVCVRPQADPVPGLPVHFGFLPVDRIAFGGKLFFNEIRIIRLLQGCNLYPVSGRTLIRLGGLGSGFCLGFLGDPQLSAPVKASAPARIVGRNRICFAGIDSLR